MTAAAGRLTIPAAYNGPLESGNGGYASGMISALLDGPAEVSLSSPVPLDVELQTAAREDGSVEVSDGEALIAEARPSAPLKLPLPPPVSVAGASRAATSYRGSDDGPFSRCFVCGRAREDALGVFAGPVEDRGVVASPWTPAQRTADENGNVRAEFTWAVLDCPTYFALYPDSTPMSFLARMSARIDRPVRAGTEHVVIAWPISKDGRKHQAGSAVLSADGEPLAIACALLIEMGSD